MLVEEFSWKTSMSNIAPQDLFRRTYFYWWCWHYYDRFVRLMSKLNIIPQDSTLFQETMVLNFLSFSFYTITNNHEKKRLYFYNSRIKENIINLTFHVLKIQIFEQMSTFGFGKFFRENFTKPNWENMKNDIIKKKRL